MGSAATSPVCGVLLRAFDEPLVHLWPDPMSARSPTAWFDGRVWRAPLDLLDPILLDRVKACGIPVLWDGVLVLDGWWRAWCLREARRAAPAPCPLRPRTEEVIAFARTLEDEHLARVTLLRREADAFVEVHESAGGGRAP